MVWFVVKEILSTLPERVTMGRKSDEVKDLEILLPPRQLAIAERKLNKPLRVSRVEKLILALLTAKLRASTNRTILQLRDSIRIFNRPPSSGGIATWFGTSGPIASRIVGVVREGSKNGSVWWPG